MLVNVSRRAIRWVLVSAASLAAVIPSSARADEAARCSDAADKGQELRDAHRLVEARELLRVCAQSLCPLVIQKECSKWLEGVESSLPTVVVSARDARGAQVVNVTVTVDGRPFAALLDGQARPIDPGVHTFHFERQGQSVEQQVAVREGERNQSITVVLDAPGGGAPPAALASLEPQEQRAIPWKATGWAVGAVGIVGLGVGTVFGLLATSEKEPSSLRLRRLLRRGSARRRSPLRDGIDDRTRRRRDLRGGWVRDRAFRAER